jgi:hypothetical protein
VIPQLQTEKTSRLMNRDLYRERNVMERLVGRLKDYRWVATRYDKLAASISPSPTSPRSGSGSKNSAFCNRVCFTGVVHEPDVRSAWNR